MAPSKEYSKEQLNYFRICYVTTDVLAEGLREIFKKEWDNRYKSTLLGEWKDKPWNGMDFYYGESPRNQKKNAHLLATMRNGNINEWDCTMLFYAILFSDCVGLGLSSTVRENVDALRSFRNEELTVIPHESLSDIDFQNAFDKVYERFQALGLPTLKIQEIQNQKTFPTGELEKILKEIGSVKQELQAKENQLEEETLSFCILPPKPAHDIESRDSEVAEITHKLRQLKEANHNRLSYLYISGNPGSGKSQLASLVAQRFFGEAETMPNTLSFVMTLNAASLDTLLSSYANFALRLKCPYYSVMQTLSSKDWTMEDKITNLKMLIAKKLSCYTSWLLIVDNVTTPSSVHVHLPQCGNKAWARGQLLVTTQDTTSIPLESSSINHISVRKGMNPDDATSLLAKISGIPKNELAKEVAQKLDFQPLALTGAAWFVKVIQQDKAPTRVGWEEYLKILGKGEQETNEDHLANSNPSHQNTMTKAIKLAVKTQVKSEKFFQHLFALLSLSAPHPLNVDIAISSYILKKDEHVDEQVEDLIRTRFKRCPLLLLDDEVVGYFIRVNQVVLDAIKTVLSSATKIVNGTLTPFDHFRATAAEHVSFGAIDNINDLVFIPEKCITDPVRAIQQHQRALAIERNTLGAEHVSLASSYSILGVIYMVLGDLEKAKEYQQRALSIDLKARGAEHVFNATSYINLAAVHEALGDLQQAKECQQRALSIDLRAHGMENDAVSTSYNNLASIHRALGDLEQAKEYQQRAVNIDQKTLGAEHVFLATSYNNLACIYKDLGDLEQAKEYHQRALTIRLQKLGANDPAVRRSYHYLAKIYKELGELEQAKDYEQRALLVFNHTMCPCKCQII